MKVILNFIINPILSIFATFLTFIHYLIVTIPFYMAIIPFLNYMKKHNVLYFPSELFIYIIIVMFSLLIIYLLIDLIFGFTIKNVIKNTYEIKDLENFEDQQELFEEVKKRFDIQNVKFMIEESDEVNAYAVASFRKKYVVITTGMLDHIINSFEIIEQRRNALKGLIAHELSHLINWDFLPNLILLSGENISFIVQRFFSLFINVLVMLFRIIPILGPLLSLLTVYTYNFFNYFLTYSYKFLIRPIFDLFEKFLSRKIEYRCDYQSANALSWESIYLTLYSFLSLNGNTYNSPFSTHPNTISRILNIYNIKSSKRKISVNFISKYFGVLLIGIISFSFVYSYIYKPYYITKYLNYINLKFSLLSNIVAEQILYIKNTIINHLDVFMQIINYLPKSYENYYIPLLILVGFIFIYLFIKQLWLSIKIKSIKNKVNENIDTPLDILLLYAIQNNDIDSFLRILKYGANIKSTSFIEDIESFASNHNPKFMKYLNKIL